MNDNDADFFEELGKRIAGLRKDCGMTQIQLGEHLGISQPVVASYEAGRRRVPSSALPVLSSLFGVTVEHLLGIRQAKGRRGRTAKLQRLFDALGKLPKHQQQRILATVEDMLIAQEAKAS